MTYHVLNGDALLDRFLATQLAGEVISDRECLIVGDVTGDTLADFWNARAAFIEASYQANESEYYTHVVSEFERLLSAPDGSEISLWFGYDLFCQVNMWFVLSLLHTQSKGYSVFIVYPIHLSGDAIWTDFGGATVADLQACFDGRVEVSESDLALGNDLWNAYKRNDLNELAKRSQINSLCFPYLKEVCTAHIERFSYKGGKGRPETVLADIISNGTTHFPAVYQAFFQREGIYGFGDVQVKQLYDQVLNG